MINFGASSTEHHQSYANMLTEEHNCHLLPQMSSATLEYVPLMLVAGDKGQLHHGKLNYEVQIRTVRKRGHCSVKQFSF